MDLSKRVDAEQLFTLELLDPTTDDPLGVVFKIRSAGSREAKAVLRKHGDANLERLQKRKLLKSADAERMELEKAASYIASWDWGPHDWKGAKPDLNMETAIEVLTEADWIFAQVVEAATDIAHFSKASVKTSPKP